MVLRGPSYVVRGNNKTSDRGMACESCSQDHLANVWGDAEHSQFRAEIRELLMICTL